MNHYDFNFKFDQLNGGIAIFTSGETIVETLLASVYLIDGEFGKNQGGKVILMKLSEV